MPISGNPTFCLPFMGNTHCPFMAIALQLVLHPSSPFSTARRSLSLITHCHLLFLASQSLVPHCSSHNPAHYSLSLIAHHPLLSPLFITASCPPLPFYRSPSQSLLLLNAISPLHFLVPLAIATFYFLLIAIAALPPAITCSSYSLLLLISQSLLLITAHHQQPKERLPRGT